MPQYRTSDLLAVILLLAGAVAVPVAGWLAGVVLLWASPSWTRRAKAWATAVIPGGLATPLVLLTVPMGEAGRCVRLADTAGVVLSESCTPAKGFHLPSWFGLTAVVLCTLAPMESAAILVQRLRVAGRRSAMAPTVI